MAVETIKWVGDHVRIIDQTKLPHRFVIIHCRDLKTLWHAIRRLSVRGAPALGVAAAFGVLLGIKSHRGQDRRAFLKTLDRVCAEIGRSRPTAVNLFNVLEDMRAVVASHPDATVAQWKQLLKENARALYEHDRRVCRQMGVFGAGLVKNNSRVLTVCNAGALATVDYGTALGVFYRAQEKGKRFSVYACETRPLLQGARLTAWELTRAKIDTVLICDSMAATLMRQGRIDAVFTGADRIAANGDTANKIGTYSLAVLARHHHIPFYIVAPLSTFDRKIKTGREIPIEERSSDEVTHFAGNAVAPIGVKVFNPAFDVTGHELITAIITERGIIRPPYPKNITRIFSANRPGSHG